MQITQLAPLTDAQGTIIEPAGIRINYYENGFQFQETRRPATGGNIKRTVLNVTTGAEETSVVPTSSLLAV